MFLAVGVAGGLVACAAFFVGVWVGGRTEHHRGNVELAELAVAMVEEAERRAAGTGDGGIAGIQQSYGLEHAADMVSECLDGRRGVFREHEA